MMYTPSLIWMARTLSGIAMIEYFLLVITDFINSVMIEFIFLTMNSMTPNQALEILKQYNDWRRDENMPNSREMPDPTEIGKAIDVAIRVLEAREMETIDNI